MTRQGTNIKKKGDKMYKLAREKRSRKLSLRLEDSLRLGVERKVRNNKSRFPTMTKYLEALIVQDLVQEGYFDRRAGIR